MNHNHSDNGRFGIVHGRYHTPEYHCWASMIQRCCNPKSKSFAGYGARGVTVCDRWTVFVNFLQDMGQRPDGTSLDRIDGAKGYEPSNCRWATSAEQCRNKRTNVFLTLNGRTQLMIDWAAELGICVPTLYARTQRYGWTHERALTEPVAPRRRT